MARTKKAKQWTGILAEPIDDVFSIMPIHYLEAPGFFQKWGDHYDDRLHRLRIEKMPELARQLGMQVDNFDLTSEPGLMVFYRQLALSLALKNEIPGFMEAKHKWHRAIVFAALEDGNARKARGERDPDFTACFMIVQTLDRKLRRKDQKPAAIQRAKTLRNEVSRLRKKIKVDCEKIVRKALKNPQPPTH